MQMCDVAYKDCNSEMLT